MLASPRCGAQTRNGGTCRAPALRGKARCRMHGGAAGSGAPWGNQNARTHGRFTRDAIAERRQIQTLLDEARKTLSELTHSAGGIGQIAVDPAAAGGLAPVRPKAIRRN
ncbi:HGGxSTG domain-containing protein [Bradyrhizobium rifense]|uniref:HGGxSTG domain-containing protein n=1 Tax=Bradyrhizobium rifense TaxID=515499 RepID=UPI0024C05084|nr:HGGxSTG domain-containing protein [Bradyrhizobium rifense]